MELQAHQLILVYSFLGAFVMGAVAHKTNFCTMGAVSDWVNMGKKGRFWAWMMAIAVAILGTIGLQAAGLVSLDDTIPPYRTPNFAWLRYIVGGALFGIGMTLAGGCGSKTLLNVGGGNLKSVLVLAVAGLFAFLMTKTTFYSTFFHGWVSATTIDLGVRGVPSQAVSDMLAAMFGFANGQLLYWLLGGLLALLIIVLAFRDKSFTKHYNNLLGGVTVGAVIVAAWYVTGGPLGREAMEAIEWMDQKPVGVGVQSYTFINPMGEFLYYLSEPANLLLVTFGVVALLGVIAGSFAYAVVAGKFRLVWFTSRSDLVKHLVGAVLMGIGGVLAMGCTIGQGITGMSTLALGSLFALISIIFGAALTMKVQYYQMVYEDEATFAGALLSSLVDMHLLPTALRKLDPP